MDPRRRIGRVGAAAAVGVVGVLLPLGAAGAAPYPNGGTPEVQPNSGRRTSGQPTDVAGNAATRSTLPLTGTDVVELAAIGAASAGVGVVLVRRKRRTSTV